MGVQVRLNQWLKSGFLTMVLIVSFRSAAAQDKGSSSGDDTDRKKPVAASKVLPPNVEAGGGLGPSPKEKTNKVEVSVLGEFLLMPVEGSPVLFNFALLDKSSGISVTSMYNIEQLRVFEAVMSAAHRFGQTDQQTGKTAAMITRFFNDQEKNFFVDVSKLGNSSQYFVTMKSRTGRVTLDSGVVKRSEPSPGTLFESLLSSLRKVLAQSNQPN